ncbi:helix-turn-helix domain-containing protein [Clostridium sp.]|uniref:helix-turn-helix domain-containing protein n=1 Tax=Clostridium sp. TaxID=1506 RepID=UPI00345B6E2A
MPKSKHFTLSERITIEHMIKDSFSFKAIARELGRDCTSISKETKHHITLKKTGSYGKSFNNCVHRFVAFVQNALMFALITKNIYAHYNQNHLMFAMDVTILEIALSKNLTIVQLPPRKNMKHAFLNHTVALPHPKRKFYVLTE